MKLDELLEEKRQEILRIASEHGARDVRVFGSVARGEADRESDVDSSWSLSPEGLSWTSAGCRWTSSPSRLPGGRSDRTRPQIAHTRACAAGGDAGLRDPRERLLDILDAIAAIERHHVQERADFEHDELLQVWYLRHLQIIGRGCQDSTRRRAIFSAGGPMVKHRRDAEHSGPRIFRH